MASSGKDSFTPYDELLAAPLTDPWTHNTGEPPCYAPDYDLLGRLLTIPVAAGAMSESGSFANGIDAWIAQELRGAGFGADEVSPRPRPAGRRRSSVRGRTWFPRTLRLRSSLPR
jgi:hypothetical protein